MPDLSRVPAVDEVGVNERVARFQSRSIKTASKIEALQLILSMIDLTTLEGQDTPGKVRQLCQKAIHLHDAMPGLPHVAAVCVYPTMVSVAKQALEGHDIKVASVATAFPSGMSTLSVKLDDTRMAVAAGADEIDMVISRGAFLAGDYRYVFDEIVAIKEACGDGAPEGDSRNRRTRHARSRAAGERSGHACGCRLHQDVDRQDPAGGDDAGDAGHAAGDPRLLSSKPGAWSA